MDILPHGGSTSHSIKADELRSCSFTKHISTADIYCKALKALQSLMSLKYFKIWFYTYVSHYILIELLVIAYLTRLLIITLIDPQLFAYIIYYVAFIMEEGYFKQIKRE